MYGALQVYGVGTLPDLGRCSAPWLHTAPLQAIYLGLAKL